MKKFIKTTLIVFIICFVIVYIFKNNKDNIGKFLYRSFLKCFIEEIVLEEQYCYAMQDSVESKIFLHAIKHNKYLNTKSTSDTIRCILRQKCNEQILYVNQSKMGNISVVDSSFVVNNGLKDYITVSMTPQVGKRNENDTVCINFDMHSLGKLYSYYYETKGQQYKPIKIVETKYEPEYDEFMNNVIKNAYSIKAVKRYSGPNPCKIKSNFNPDSLFLFNEQNKESFCIGYNLENIPGNSDYIESNISIIGHTVKISKCFWKNPYTLKYKNLIFNIQADYKIMMKQIEKIFGKKNVHINRTLKIKDKCSYVYIVLKNMNDIKNVSRFILLKFNKENKIIELYYQDICRTFKNPLFFS